MPQTIPWTDVSEGSRLGQTLILPLTTDEASQSFLDSLMKICLQLEQRWAPWDMKWGEHTVRLQEISTLELSLPLTSLLALDFPSMLKVEMTGDFPDGPVVKNPLCNAEDKGSIPGGGTKIPHVTRQLLSPWTLESMCHNYWACALQQNILHDSTKIPSVTAKLWCNHVRK